MSDKAGTGTAPPSSFILHPSSLKEREAFLLMQGRLVELLLRYDAPRFGTTFDERVADGLDDPRLRRYRELAVLFYLREELFASILPRIKRRLSFVAPREVQVESLPPRGRIDWSRTLTASLRNHPGEPPLEVQTRQRRRHFATPENLLTVATLIEYRAAVQRVLDNEAAQDRAQALRHPLQEIIGTCTRELVFPQFAGLERAASEIVEGRVATTPTELERQVARGLAPGRNSAYDDLIAWRQRLRRLTLLQRDTTVVDTTAFGADPETDNRLYQLWIFFELADLLRAESCCGPEDLSLQPLRLRFRWEGCGYELYHDQGVPQPVAAWSVRRGDARRVPGVRPDFYLWRTDPPRAAVRDGDREIWREPGVIWDAKYYRERERDSAPSSPIKRMIADLNLLGEPYGVLLFAFLKEGADVTPGYLLAPDAVRSQTLVPDQQVIVAQVPPALPGEGSKLRSTFLALIKDAHRRLRTPAEIRCHGVFLDGLTVNAHGALAGAEALRYRDGSALTQADTPAETALDTLLLCPKPHIGPWRVDIVSLERDCCQNAKLCHILGAGVPDIQRPSRLTRLEDIARAIRTAGDDEHGERAEAATRQVRLIAQRYADLIQPNLAEFTAWVRDELDVGELFDLFPFLTQSLRDTLGLGRFLWQQIDAIRASNFAGPTLLFTGVLEELVRQTIYARCPPLIDGNGRGLPKTLGTVGSRWNRVVLTQALTQGQHWEPKLTDTTRLTFDTWADLAWRVSRIRNQAAHEAHVSPGEFRDLQQLYFGSKRTGFGALNGLLLAWREPGAA